MIHSRHHSREIALQFLYLHDSPTSQTETSSETSTLAGELRTHFEHFHVSQELREFAALLASGVIRETHEIDRILEGKVDGWKLSRLALVDRNLLRLAAYELLKMPETPPHVVIDEAIELAKQFGTAETPSFINGILDAILKTKDQLH